MISATRLENFHEELKHFIDYLNNVPIIDELHLGYALKDRCMLHVLRNGRLLDGDLSSYADTLLLIYDTWKGGNLDYAEGFGLRSNIIKIILKEFPNYIFLSRFVAPGQPFELEKYDTNSNDFGVLLRI